jgi:integrase
MNFTDSVVRNLKPKAKMYQQREGKGFGVRVLPSGHKIWIFTYTFDGKRRQMNLGSYPDLSLADARSAYSAAYSILHDKHNPRDPQTERDQKHDVARQQREEHRQAPTVSGLIKEYIEKHAQKKNRNWQDIQRMLNKEVASEWGNRKAKDITKRDVNLLLEKIIDRGSPATSNQVLKHTRKMFNFAIEQDIQQHSPCLGVKIKAKETPRERCLTEEEIRIFWNALDNCSISDDVCRALKLILVTGQRPGEVSGMHTGEIDGRWWTIPGEAIYTVQAKNHMTHRVYLTDTALDLIGSLKKIDKNTGKVMIDPATGKQVDKGYIFPCPHGSKEQPIDTRALAHAVLRNLNWPVLHNGKPVYNKEGKPVTENRLGVEPFTPHDLRRTATTLMAKCKIGLEHRERVLNHKQGKLDGTYNQHDYDDEKQMAMQTLERKINSIITGEASGKVIPIIRQAV